MSIGKKFMDFIVPTKVIEEEIEVPVTELPIEVRSMNGNGTRSESTYYNTSEGAHVNGKMDNNGLDTERNAYSTTNIKSLVENAKLDSREWHNLLKRSVKIILAHRELKNLDDTTLPKVADDLALILQASGTDATTMLGDIATLKKIVRDGVNQNLKLIGDYRNKKGYEINSLIARLKELEQEVDSLDKISADDTQNMTDALEEYEYYSKMLELVSKTTSQTV
jgi:hypothetical protein